MGILVLLLTVVPFCQLLFIVYISCRLIDAFGGEDNNPDNLQIVGNETAIFSLLPPYVWMVKLIP